VEKSKNLEKSPFGSRLREARIKKGFSQAELAALLGYKRDVSVSNLETSRAENVGLGVLARLAEVLDVDLHWLITGQESPGEKNVRAQHFRLLRALITLLDATLGMSDMLVHIIDRLGFTDSEKPAVWARENAAALIRLREQLLSAAQRVSEADRRLAPASDLLEASLRLERFGLERKSEESSD
jgi:transcriptional regulator with XRE-family HTH domain